MDQLFSHTSSYELQDPDSEPDLGQKFWIRIRQKIQIQISNTVGILPDMTARRKRAHWKRTRRRRTRWRTRRWRAIWVAKWTAT
jgi:hypothetical protein